MLGLEYKNVSGGIIKDIDTKNNIITGYLSKFGNKDYDGDIIEKGAYSKSIKERGPSGSNGIYFLNQHKWEQPHGKFKELEEDSFGLRFVSEPLIETTYSSDAVKLYAAGIIKEHSVGFETKRSEGEYGDRVLTELKLYEGSNVTLGANPQTPFTGFKSGIKEIEEQSSIIYKAIRNGNFTDETFILLEIALKQLQREAFELGKKEITRTPSVDTSAPMLIAIDNFINDLTLT